MFQPGSQNTFSIIFINLHNHKLFEYDFCTFIRKTANQNTIQCLKLLG
jgi:hypothetical protein